MDSKYNLTREQNIFIAKRNIVDYIYKSAKLEGLSVTYPDTDAIYRGITVQGLSVSDVVAINNLKHAWRFLLDTLDVPMDYAYLCKLNQLVGGGLFYNPGYIRTLPVSIGGTKWKPDMPDEEDIKSNLTRVSNTKNPIERAIFTLLYCMRGQFFLDGNKRTAMLAANQIMVATGQGIISVPEEMIAEFLRLLVGFYEGGDQEDISLFIYRNCIDGIPFENGV